MNLALDALSLAHQHRLAGPPPWMFALLENAFGLPRPLMKLKKKLLSALLLSFLLNALATAAETVAGVEAGTAAGFVVVAFEVAHGMKMRFPIMTWKITKEKSFGSYLAARLLRKQKWLCQPCKEIPSHSGKMMPLS